MTFMDNHASANSLVVDGSTNIGENGLPQYSAMGVGDPRVSLFFDLVRNLPSAKLENLVHKCIRQAEQSSDSLMLADMFVLAFQTRSCRNGGGGKGERSLFFDFLLILFRTCPHTVIACIPLIAEYGSYKDYFTLMRKCAQSEIYAPLQNAILDFVASILKEDSSRLANLQCGVVSPSVSLCAKYAPKEGRQFATDQATKHLFKSLLGRVFPGEHMAGLRVKYRKLLSQLTRALDITEVKMCSKRFSEIDFKHVPSVLSNKCRKAFLNENVKPTPIFGELVITGNRFPDDPDRVSCRAHLREAVVSKKLNGKQLMPHEIVTQLMNGSRDMSSMSSLEVDMLDCQWGAIRQSVVDSLAAVTTGSAPQRAGEAVDLGKIVPLVDVSGSMSGIPMQVAIALGILVSEVNHPAFRNRFITFEDSPRWVDLSRATNIKEKVEITQAAPWGMSTNFEAAFNLILNVVSQHRLPMSEVPDLIVFSDMQFNVASGRAGGGGSRPRG